MKKQNPQSNSESEDLHQSNGESAEPTPSPTASGDESSEQNDCSRSDGRRYVDSAELRRKLKSYNELGSRRPLRRLAATEEELDAQSKALAKLRGNSRRNPDDPLVALQLRRATNTRGVPRTMEREIQQGAIAQYHALNAEDPIDATLDRLVVGLSNACMDCLGRVARGYDVKSADIDLRHAEKTAAAVANLIRLRDSRRNPGQIKVGNVNVEAGGQAIVGNVETKRLRRKKPTTKKANG